MRVRHAVLCLSVLVLGVPPGAAAPAVIPCTDPRGCPDLVVDATRVRPFVSVETVAPDDCQVVEGVTEPGTRSLLRFTLTTPNAGAGDLVVGPPAARPDAFEYSPCHGHHHFREYAEYRVWTEQEYARYTAFRTARPALSTAEILRRRPDLRPVTGRKAGFCMMDVHQYDPMALPKYLTCDVQGVSAGWADEYGPYLDGQYVDVTGVAPGTYVLEIELNPGRLFEEADYTNDRAAVTVSF